MTAPGCFEINGDVEEEKLNDKKLIQTSLSKFIIAIFIVAGFALKSLQIGLCIILYLFLLLFQRRLFYPLVYVSQHDSTGRSVVQFVPCQDDSLATFGLRL